MTEVNHTNPAQNHEHGNPIVVHSNATLIKAGISASLIAGLVLVTAILPAEYNIDPTGIGQVMGLTKIAQAAQTDSNRVNIGESELKLATTKLEIATAPSVAQIQQVRAAEPGIRQDTIDIVIAAGKGLEYKLLMNEGKHLEYDWQTDGGQLYFDFHGEPQGDSTGFYESFAITTANKMKGALTTPFSGSHGWYWKNKTNRPITVTLSTKGAYLIKG